MRYPCRRGIKTAGVLVVAALMLSACSSGSGGADAPSTAPTSSTAPVAGTSKIDSFDVPATVACSSDTDTTFEVSWKVSGAEKTVIQVDGAPVPGTGDFSGSAKAQVHCDPLPHDVVLIATDKDGHFTTQRKIVTTTGGAGS